MDYTGVKIGRPVRVLRLLSATVAVSVSVLCFASFPPLLHDFLAAMDIHLHHNVLSPINYDMFETWAASADLFDLADALLKVYLVAHREEDHLGEVPRPPVIIQRPDLDMYFTVKEKPCEHPRCRKCLERKGGYRFDWVGPWTCQCIVALVPTTLPALRERHLNCPRCFPPVVDLDLVSN